MTSEKERRQEAEWQILHDRVSAVLDQFGRKNPFGEGDYWLIDENWGWQDLQLGFQNLDLLRPTIIKKLQELLVDFPDWRIAIEVDVLEGGSTWPQMVFIIYSDEIVDVLQRNYLPEPYRSFKYDGSRPETGAGPAERD